MGSLIGGLAKDIGATNTFQAKTPEIQEQMLLGRIRDSNTAFNQNTDQQQQLAQMLLRQAQGDPNSPAALALQQATQQNIAQNAGIVASQKGLSNALAGRLAAQNAATQNQAAALQSGQLQLQSQTNLGALYNQMAGQQLQNQSTLQNAQAQQNQIKTQGSLGAQQINAGVAANNAQMRTQLAGGVMQGLSGVGMMFANPGAAATQAVSQAAAPTAQTAAPVALNSGGVVPGVAEVSGDHIANDKVPAMLSPKEIVLPRSVTLAKDAPEKAKRFVEDLKKHGGHAKKPKGYGHVLEAHRELVRRVMDLEKRVKGGK